MQNVFFLLSMVSQHPQCPKPQPRLHPKNSPYLQVLSHLTPIPPHLTLRDRPIVPPFSPWPVPAVGGAGPADRARGAGLHEARRDGRRVRAQRAKAHSRRGVGGPCPGHRSPPIVGEGAVVAAYRVFSRPVAL